MYVYIIFIHTHTQSSPLSIKFKLLQFYKTQITLGLGSA